jgi:hypothetical protein
MAEQVGGVLKLLTNKEVPYISILISPPSLTALRNDGLTNSYFQIGHLLLNIYNLIFWEYLSFHAA